MLEADTDAGDYWKKCGDEALAHGVKGIIIMVGVIIQGPNAHLTLTDNLGCSLELHRRQNRRSHKSIPWQKRLSVCHALYLHRMDSESGPRNGEALHDDARSRRL